MKILLSICAEQSVSPTVKRLYPFQVTAKSYEELKNSLCGLSTSKRTIGEAVLPAVFDRRLSATHLEVWGMLSYTSAAPKDGLLRE